MPRPDDACLDYVGDGLYIIGVPTTHLCDVADEEAQRLIASGLYVRAPHAESADQPYQTTALVGPMPDPEEPESPEPPADGAPDEAPSE